MEHGNCKAEGAAVPPEPALGVVLPETQSSLPLKKKDGFDGYTTCPRLSRDQMETVLCLLMRA